MKGMVLGVLGVGAAGTAVVYGGGPPAIDDYVGIVHKAPERVYAAFSALGQEGETRLPGVPGKPTLVQRITKVPNRNVKLEYLVDGQHLLSAEVQLDPADGGTQVAAEFDLNGALVQQLAADNGTSIPLPALGFAEPIMDQAFGMAMEEMVKNIEEGRPLPSFSETRARWGSDSRNSADGRMSGRSGWQEPERVRPQASARPAVDPNRVAEQHRNNATRSTGW